MTEKTDPAGPPHSAAPHLADDLPHDQQTEDYGGGHIQARHGRVNGWLLVVYAVLFAWALYYGYTYWGGLGPGLDLSK